MLLSWYVYFPHLGFPPRIQHLLRLVLMLDLVLLLVLVLVLVGQVVAVLGPCLSLPGNRGRRRLGISGVEGPGDTR